MDAGQHAGPYVRLSGRQWALDNPGKPDWMNPAYCYGPQSAAALAALAAIKSAPPPPGPVSILAEALRRWLCPSCGGSKVYTQRSALGGSREVPCKVCSGTDGLHPTAFQALLAARVIRPEGVVS